MGITITQSRLLICEGSSDQAFFKHLIRKRNLPLFDVFKPGDLALPGGGPGKDGFRVFLEGISVPLASANVSVILLAGDNDLDHVASFENIQRQLREAVGGYGVPAAPLQLAKSAAIPPLPPVIVMMLPWMGENGALETILLDSIYANQAGIRACIDEYCRCTHADTLDQVKQSKMRIQALLAAICRSNPAAPLQGAWNQREENLIALDHHSFDRIADFIRNIDALL